MDEKNRKPKIRFAGFTEDWEQLRLGDCVQIQRGGSPRPIEKFITDNENGINWVKIGDVAEGSRYITSTKEKIKPEGEKYSRRVYVGDLVLSNSMSFGRPYIMKINGCIHDGWLLIRNEKNIFNIEYLLQLLSSSYTLKQYKSLASGGVVNNLNSELVQSTTALLPPIDEQQKIGTFFRHLDHLITLHQRKRERLVNIKKAMLEKMFPKKGADVPEVRFARFTEAWEQRKFGDIVTPYADPVPTPTDGYYRLGIRSHAKGTFHNYVRPGMELGTAQMHRVAVDNFIVNITFGWEHAVAITDENDAEKLVSHRFPQFSFNTGMVPDFFKFVIMDENFRHHLWLASPGGAGRNRVLKIDEMLEYKFWVPSADEQRQIALFLEYLDHLITLHQHKVELLQNIKKACLETMFV